MKLISKLSLISALCGLVACNAESRIELKSFDMASERHNEIISGYIVTEQKDLLSVPEEFIKIHNLSHHLLEQHWLQNPNFIGDVTELKRLFRETRLPEAASFIATLNATKQRYLNNLDNVNAIAFAMQRDADKDLDGYQNTLEQLQHKIQLLETPEEAYHKKVASLEKEIRIESKRYGELSKSLHGSLQKILDDYMPGSQLIHQLKFNYDNLPHAMCRQFRGMSELVASISSNCVYINRDQMLSAFPASLADEANKVINEHVPDLWRSMTRLNGYFDTSTNSQFFKDNLRSQLAKTRQALREKRYLDQQQSEKLLENFKMQLASIEGKRSKVIDKGYLDQELRVDTASKAFIRLMKKAQSPTLPYSEVYYDAGLQESFTKAYAKKLLTEYPAELYFTVSSDGVFSIPREAGAQQLVFNFADSSQYLTYDVVIQSSLPQVIDSQDQHAEMSSHSLLDELKGQLQKLWDSKAIASASY